MLPSLYEATKTEVKELMNADMVYICLTTDMWTSRNRDCFLALTEHFIDRNMKLRTVLLECCALNGVSPTDVSLADESSKIPRAWNIENKILLAVSKNGSNIKCAIEICLIWKHFSCYGHCLNLVVSKALENETINIVIQKNKTIVAHLKKSNDAWGKLKCYLEQTGKPIKRTLQEVPTRWNSTFYMLDRLIELKEELNSALSNLIVKVPILTVFDWNIIEKLVLILKPCEEVTKEISSDKYVTGSSVIPVSIALKSALVASRFTSLENSHTFTTCMFLDPRFISKMRTRQSPQKIYHWIDEETPNPTNSDKSIWTHYYKKMSRPSGIAYSRAVIEVQLYIDDKILTKAQSTLEWWHKNQNTPAT